MQVYRRILIFCCYNAIDKIFKKFFQKKLKVLFFDPINVLQEASRRLPRRPRGRRDSNIKKAMMPTNKFKEEF